MPGAREPPTAVIAGGISKSEDCLWLKRASASARRFLARTASSAGRDFYLGLFNVSKILPFIRRAISEAGSGFWHSDSGLSQKLELGNISNRLRAAAPRQVSGSFT